MIAPFVIVGVGGYAAFFIWRVRVEKGWVGISDFKRALLSLIASIKLLDLAFGETFLPVVRSVARKMARLGEAFEE